MTDLWICGKYLSGDEMGSVVWEFVGVFSSEELAVAACLCDTYFVAPAKLDKAFPDETLLWPGVYYPLANNDETDA